MRFDPTHPAVHRNNETPEYLALGPAQRACFDTLLVVAGLFAESDNQEESEFYADWAKMVLEQPLTAEFYDCCPFCSELECDDDCPLRYARKELKGGAA